MTTLFKIFGIIIMTLVFIICVLACIYIISIELYEIFEVDVLFKTKRKLERLVYSDGKRKAMGRMFRRGKSRSTKNRKRYESIKRKLRQRAFEQKAILSKKEKNIRKN